MAYFRENRAKKVAQNKKNFRGKIIAETLATLFFLVISQGNSMNRRNQEVNYDL